jgi:predicted ATPase
VAYNSLLIERRKQLHESAGQALESMFAGQLEDHLDELAHHYSRSDNIEKAVEYLERAGQQALQRSAYADAISSLGATINLLQKLPDSPERSRRELPLLLAIGPALIAVRGYGAPETERAYTRARELCERLGDPWSFSPPCMAYGPCICCEETCGGPMSLPNSYCDLRRACTSRCTLSSV